MAYDWRALPPQQVLDDHPCLTVGQVAYVIGAHRRNGELNRGHVIDLVKRGLLQLVDPEQTVQRWTISQACVRSYLDGKSKRGAA